LILDKVWRTVIARGEVKNTIDIALLALSKPVAVVALELGVLDII